MRWESCLGTRSAGVLRAVFDGLISYLILSYPSGCAAQHLLEHLYWVKPYQHIGGLSPGEQSWEASSYTPPRKQSQRSPPLIRCSSGWPPLLIRRGSGPNILGRPNSLKLLVGNMFPWQGGTADPKETVREWKRQLKSQQRALDKQIRGALPSRVRA